MKKLSIIGVIGIVLSYAALAHEGHEHATGVVRERMELMTDMGKRLLSISKRLRANRELDRIAPDARAIKEASSKIMGQFPLGSTQFPTAAKPVVWQQWDDFIELKSCRQRLISCQLSTRPTVTCCVRNSALSRLRVTVVTKPIECRKKNDQQPALNGTVGRQ